MVSQLNDEHVAKLNSFLKMKDDEIKDTTLLFLRNKLNAVIAKTPEVRNKIRGLSTQLQSAQADLANLLNLQNYLGTCIIEELAANVKESPEKKGAECPTGPQKK